MSRAKGILTGGRALTQWVNQDATKGTLIQKIVTAINTLADNNASSAVGRLPPPPPINGINVVTGGEYAHVTIEHNSAIQQGIQYAVEVATNPSFAGAHPIDYGTSRTRDPIHMAPLDSDGNPQTWYVRAIAQYPGSDPSEPTVYGGASPTPITTTGTTRLTWNRSTGSGTSSGNGQQVGWFYGKTLRRDK